MTNNHKLGIFKDIPKNVTGEAWHVQVPCQEVTFAVRAFTKKFS